MSINLVLLTPTMNSNQSSNVPQTSVDRFASTKVCMTTIRSMFFSHNFIVVAVIQVDSQKM